LSEPPGIVTPEIVVVANWLQFESVKSMSVKVPRMAPSSSTRRSPGEAEPAV
jgi:hypothetical protein